MSYIYMMLIFVAAVTLFVALIPSILWLLGYLPALLAGRHLRYAPFGYASLTLAIVVILLLAYGYWVGRWNLCVKEIEYHNDSLPSAFQGFRIVHISDLHLCTFDGNPGKLQKFVDAINAQNPDLVCFTGDLVTISEEEAQPYTRVLNGISARCGVVSVFGNHDFLIYDRAYADEEERLDAVEEFARYQRDELGWTLLRDSSKVITASDGSAVTIVGVDNKNCTGQGFKTINSGDLSRAIEGVDGFTILLSHDPGHWDAEVLPQTDIPLMLSGHTHAAQFSLFGWTPSSWMFTRTYGRYDMQGQTVYVNPGLGCTLPFRIGARPEITVITLK